jgi:hypothetical protein
VDRGRPAGSDPRRHVRRLLAADRPVEGATHPCWKVQKALGEQGIEYELVPGPGRRSRRSELENLSGQRRYPVIEFPDGTVYREESADMAARIRSGRLASVDTRQAAS